MNALTPQTPDTKLWKLARNRAQFKLDLLRYALVSLLLWAIWYFTGHRVLSGHHVPWPAWIMLFWGFGLLLKGMNCYGFLGTRPLTEREYEQLRRQREAGQR